LRLWNFKRVNSKVFSWFKRERSSKESFKLWSKGKRWHRTNKES